MFRHVAMFRWAAGTTPEQVEAVRRALSETSGSIPELQDYRVGADLGLREGNWDFVVVADFADADGWRAYVAHPAHQKVIADLIQPLTAERASVQYDC